MTSPCILENCPADLGFTRCGNLCEAAGSLSPYEIKVRKIDTKNYPQAIKSLEDLFLGYVTSYD